MRNDLRDVMSLISLMTKSCYNLQVSKITVSLLLVGYENFPEKHRLDSNNYVDKVKVLGLSLTLSHAIYNYHLRHWR